MQLDRNSCGIIFFFSFLLYQDFLGELIRAHALETEILPIFYYYVTNKTAKEEN